MGNHHRIETVVIGGGQVGLGVGHQLQKCGRPFVILDASERVGDAWRKRWDSLRLFTPARYNGLPGMRFPAPGNSIVTKDQMADFLDAYAAHFGLPVKNGRRVDKLTRAGETYVVNAGNDTYEADNVVVAMGKHQIAKIPDFASELDPNIVQIHSGEYRSPEQLQPGETLIVGTANSAADIALELSENHRTFMAGNDVGEIPFRIEPAINRRILVRLVRFVGHHVLSLRTPAGRKVQAKLEGRGMPRVRVKMRDLLARGVQRVPRVRGVTGGLPELEDGRALNVRNVVWCTGFTAGFDWIDLRIFDSKKRLRHERGIVPDHPGLYFVGLQFLFAATSETIVGFQRDAVHVIRHLDQRMGARKSLPTREKASNPRSLPSSRRTVGEPSSICKSD